MEFVIVVLSIGTNVTQKLTHSTFLVKKKQTDSTDRPTDRSKFFHHSFQINIEKITEDKNLQLKIPRLSSPSTR
ncbi:hypothetical protein DERP_014981 [Dermatophagoides pteronyssinus]|uniref:Uncharacterized protein n=1 Tax=Dermatophagoides pteronyssinus TaxID=6956 RepID=A0ABQ8JWS1_DERPT|nr:hypothetical protein DERP_014981 [Dermatophagoides pteronyssinus]